MTYKVKIKTHKVKIKTYYFENDKWIEGNDLTLNTAGYNDIVYSWSCGSQKPEGFKYKMYHVVIMEPMLSRFGLYL